MALTSKISLFIVVAHISTVDQFSSFPLWQKSCSTFVCCRCQCDVVM